MSIVVADLSVAPGLGAQARNGCYAGAPSRRFDPAAGAGFIRARTAQAPAWLTTPAQITRSGRQLDHAAPPIWFIGWIRVPRGGY